jgi:CDP-glucose 4,6-dehydratase
VQEVLKHWPGRWEDRSDPHAVHEAKLLNLATDKAHHFLHWQPVWNFAETVAHTVAWYRACIADAASAPSLTSRQIAHYTSDARARSLAWAA